jgi:NAD(P)H-flavin reductase
VAEVAARLGPWRDHDFFVSGSPSMVKTTLRSLAQMKIPHGRIRYDSFSDH